MDFEDSTILETLAEHGLEDAFYDAVDSDDFKKITKLLRQAGVTEEKIFLVLQAIS